jgi:type III secretion system FlhB-like substrate exporter
MTERILVVDPGERVGWAHANITSNDVEVTGHGITPLKDFALKLHEVAGNYDTIIYEQYRIYAHLAKQHIGSDIPTAQFVGMVKLCAWLNPQVKLVSQGANCMKTGVKVAPPAIAEILERLPKSHDEAHDGSALAHLSFYWFKNYAS